MEGTPRRNRECAALAAKGSEDFNAVLAWPNVRAKVDPAVGRQARETENSKGRLAGLVARRWGSP